MRVTFLCEICGTEKSKQWAQHDPRTPRYCSMDCKAEAQRRKKPVTKEWLYERYIVEGLDCTAIGKLVSRDPKRVWEWLKSFDIPTRKRGTTGNWVHSIGAPRSLTDAGRKSLSIAAKAARLRDGHVPYLKNGVHHLKGKRGAETPNWKGGMTPERQEFYSSEAWKEAVKIVWKRDNARCQRCDKHHNTTDNRGTFDIHHITSFAVKELRCEIDNLILLCEQCHYWVHGKDNTNREFLGDGTSD